MQKKSLFQQLQDKEIQEFGEKTHPLTTNITTSLIPIAETLLNRIPAFMPEYTMHDIKHCETILDIIQKLLPEEVELNIVELTILIQSVYLHDIGMVVNRDAAEEVKKTEDFKNLLIEFDKESDEDQILTEFIRRTHVQRSLDYIELFKSDFKTYQIKFEFKGIDISDWVKNVIESHSLSVKSLEDLNKYPRKKLIDNYEVNVHYISLLLRLGDILDFDVFRTPYFLYQHINPQNSISNDEWQKHLSIEGKKITSTEIKFEAKCSSAKIERSVRSFVDWIEFERKESMNFIDSSSNYVLHLKNEADLKVRNDGSYIYSDLKLELEYQKVLKILMGTELYDSPNIFIRELLQNSYDACKYRQELAKKSGEPYEPKIEIDYDRKLNSLTIEDNGIGIDERTFKNYILKIGNSYYTSKSFEKEQLGFEPISNFGIGILSCFMVSDSIEIESLKYGLVTNPNEPIHYTLLVNDKYIERYSSGKSQYGTKIKLTLHDDYQIKLSETSIKDIVLENTSHQKIPIIIKENGTSCELNNQEIEVPEDYESISDIEIVSIDSIPWLEGFIVVHQGQHQGIIEQNKISQQGFTISRKGGSIPLNVGWLKFCRFFINILPEHKLNLMASREGVKNDEKLATLQRTLIEIIVDYFDEKTNKPRLLNYLNEGRGKVFSGSSKEFDFLTKNVPIFFWDKKQPDIQTTSFSRFISENPGNRTFAIVSLPLIQKLSSESSVQLMEELKKYDLVILAIRTIHYFIQFSRPYTESNEIIVASLPGLVYNRMTFKTPKENKLDDYDLDYSWSRSYNILSENELESIFCVVNNHQYNSMDIQINYSHPLGKLLKDAEKTSYAKRFLGSFKTNLTVALIKGSRLTNYFKHDGESHYMVDNTNPYSLNTIGFMEPSFIKSLNTSMKKDLLIPLAKLNFVDIDEVDNYLLTSDEFPKWWIK